MHVSVCVCWCDHFYFTVLTLKHAAYAPRCTEDWHCMSTEVVQPAAWTFQDLNPSEIKNVAARETVKLSCCRRASQSVSLCLCICLHSNVSFQIF